MRLVWWMPLRTLESMGFIGVWAGLALFSAALPVLILLFFIGNKSPAISARTLISGMMVGGAMMLYSMAVTETTVVRAILLFYLAPAWTITLECVFLGRKFRAINILAFALAAIGILIIFRGHISLSNWNIGDLMSLASGLCWAIGSTLVFSGKDMGARNIGMFACMGAIGAGLAIVLISGASLPEVENLPQVTGYMALFGTIYIIPTLIATLWSARRLNPTTLSFLLTGEIISGVISSAVFLSEPFGWPEIIGSCVIICAALVEIISPKKAG